MRKWFSATLTAMLLCSSLAYAADEIPPAKLAVAKELVVASGATQLSGTADIMADAIGSQLKKALPDIDNETLEAMHKIAREEFDAARPAMIEETTKIYARRFSEAEMHDMIVFYKSPTGQRVVAETPMIVRECAQMSSEISGRIIKRFQNYMQQRASKEQPAQ